MTTNAIAAGIDLGFTRDSAGLVIVKKRGNVRHVVAVEQCQGHAANDPRAVVEHFKRQLRSHEIERASADVHYRQLLLFELAEAGIELVNAPDPGLSWIYLRRLASAGLIRIPAQFAELIDQLKRVRGKPLPGGRFEIQHPRGTGGHGDLAAALAPAIWLLKDSADAPPLTIKARSAAFAAAKPGRMTDFPDNSDDYAPRSLGSSRARFSQMPNRWR